jgi:hypothetical protein
MTYFIEGMVRRGLRDTFPIRKNSSKREHSWWGLPYCLEVLKDGRLIVLNRGYKPLGVKTDLWVDYESSEFDYSKVSSYDINLKLLEDGFRTVFDGTDKYYFYTDENSPRYKNSHAVAYVTLVESVFSPLVSSLREF